MLKSIRDQINDATPKVNPDIGNGLVNKHIKDIESYVNSIFQIAFKDFDLKYLGYDKCTPKEELDKILTNKQKARIDVSKSNIYMVRYYFQYKGEDLPPLYLYLPYLEQGGILYLSGSAFSISPVLADKIISVGMNDVFVRLIRDKLNFKRACYSYLSSTENSINYRESIQYVYSVMYRKKNKSEKTVKPFKKANHLLVHYLFAKYGVSETFQKFFGFVPEIGDSVSINETTHPLDQYVICQSMNLNSLNSKKNVFYMPTDIRIAVRKEQYTTALKKYIVAFFYITDLFPDRVNVQDVDKPRLWIILLALMIFPNNISEGKLESDIRDHFSSLNNYVDDLVKVKLKESKIKDVSLDCNDIYELFNKIVVFFDDWIQASRGRVNSMYDKEISVLYYVCSDIIMQAFYLLYELKPLSKKHTNINVISKTINKFLKPTCILGLKNKSGYVSGNYTSGDNKYFKLTSILVPQESATTKKKKGGGISIGSATNNLHASIIEVGNAFGMPKTDPVGTSRINAYLNISPVDCTVQRNEELRETLDNFQERIRRE